jgi:putative DNA modification/repair radical SAM protein
MATSIEDKLALLADAAKYDASCASSESTRRDSRAGRIGSTGGSGICHSYAPDGRCISLLKILLTNFCVYDCAYCINRRSSNVQRARFSVEEVVRLTLDFYKRNYIEGLFLSSGVIRNPDYTMEELVRVARTLREDHHFRGYIHLKTIPDASLELVEEAGRYADRISINVELPTDAGLNDLAPEKRGQSIRRAMAGMRLRIDEARAEKNRHRFAPAGQSTQMIVGADGADDRTILAASASLYSSYGLRRVYYSAFGPIPDASAKLPLKAPPLRREHRLYQADWLFRFYGFAVEELPLEHGSQMLDLEIDPKLAWALHRALFPVDLNRGSP